MKAELKIIDYLLENGRSKSSDIHDHMVSTDVKRKTSQKAIGNLYKKKLVDLDGDGPEREYWLTDGAKKESGNEVFDQYREVSIGYQITKMLRVTKSSWEVSQ